MVCCYTLQVVDVYIYTNILGTLTHDGAMNRHWQPLQRKKVNIIGDELRQLASDGG